MSARTSKTAPRAIVDFLGAVCGSYLPDDVHHTLTAIRDAIFSSDPVPALNRSLGQLKRRHPSAISSLDGWLKSPATKELARKSGCCWTLEIWQSACEKLMQGAKAHVAFGMDSTGRSSGMEFGPYEDAAILAEHRSRYVRGETATESAQELPDGRVLDRRELQRHRKLIRLRNHSAEDLCDQARLVEAKHRKT